MKKFINPEMNVVLFDKEDIVTTSAAPSTKSAAESAEDQIKGTGIGGLQTDKVVTFSF